MQKVDLFVGGKKSSGIKIGLLFLLTLSPIDPELVAEGMKSILKTVSLFLSYLFPDRAIVLPSEAKQSLIPKSLKGGLAAVRRAKGLPSLVAQRGICPLHQK